MLKQLPMKTFFVVGQMYFFLNSQGEISQN